jgi:phage FluMu protein Com
MPIRSTSERSRGSQAITEASATRVVPKPVPKGQVENARRYQIDQIRKRFSPKESVAANGDTLLAFGLVPSDPDFPFELAKLHCELCVPTSYPSRPVKLHVKNTDIPRGFAINIERGWENLVSFKQGATILALVNSLDRKLESFLSEQKVNTVKLTIFKDTRHIGEEPESSMPPEVTNTPILVQRSYIPEPWFSRDEIAEAKARRAQETRQLEARMGRLPQYQRSSDGIVYTLPFEPKRRLGLPTGLQSVKSVQLIVPLLYPLQTLRILLNDVDSGDAEPVEDMFSDKSREQKEMTLMSHVNYLAQNLHALANQAQAQSELKASMQPEPGAGQEHDNAESAFSENGYPHKHIHVIPRPPEWNTVYGSGHPGSSDYDSEAEDEIDDEDEEGGAALEPRSEEKSAQSGSDPQTVEKGTSMSFPSIELHGIEVLQVKLLSIGVKCERCRTINEVGGLQENAERHSESCRKCATSFVIRWRPGFVTQNSTRAGFIDSTGCTTADLLPRYENPVYRLSGTPFS